MANWRSLREAVQLYSEHYLPALVANDGPFAEGCVWAVFACGTVVPFALNEQDETRERAGAFDYDPLHDEAWPRYRLLDPLRATMRKNVRTYRRTLAACTEPILVKAATMFLMAGGYPPPGADISDTITYPLVRGLWGTIFRYMPSPDWAPFLNTSIASLALDGVDRSVPDTRDERELRGVAHAADHFGRDARRIDYMFPRVAAIIKADLSVTYLD